jgi:hypothetical protein
MNFEQYCSLWKSVFRIPVYINSDKNMVFFEYTNLKDLVQNDLTNPFILMKKFTNLGFYSGDKIFFEQKYSSSEWRTIVKPEKCKVFLNR